MQNQHYPALYRAANDASMKAQARHLGRVRVYSLFLMLAAGLGVYGINDKVSAICAAIVIIFSILLSIWMLLQKDEDSWYRARAVAESVKTSTWRFMMRADPFLDASSMQIVKAQFRDRLKQLLDEHKYLSHELGGKVSQEEQITEGMCNIRALSLDERKSYYQIHRIDEQRSWYAEKSACNIKQSMIWFSLLIGCQVIAMIFVILRVAYPEWRYLPTEVFLVAASGALTWIQVKRFRELASAYGLTAHEIGVIRGELEDANSESGFAQFVIDSESAFSREHTQWLARKDVA